MDAAALGLAIIPPTLAALVEAVNPINERLLRNSALVDFETLRASDLFLDTVGRATTFSAAAVEISGLAPTLVASITSGFAVIHELPEPFWPAILYSLIFVGIVLFLIWLLSGTTFHKVGINKVRIGFHCGLQLHERGVTEDGWTRQDIVRTVIYLGNIALIAASILVFCALNWHLILQYV